MELKEAFTWVFDWYLQDYCGAVLDKAGNRGRPAIAREVYRRIDYALRNVADPNGEIKHKGRTVSEYWPDLLKNLGLKNKICTKRPFQKFAPRYVDFCEGTHNISRFDTNELPDELFFRTLLESFSEEIAGKFWSCFCAGYTTDVLEDSNCDQAAAYFWLDLTRLAASGTDPEILVHWENQKAGKIQFEAAPGIQNYKPSIEDMSEKDPLLKEMLGLHRFLKEEQPSLLDELLHRQSSHINKMKLLNDSSSMPQLPDVIHFQIEGDSGERVVSWTGREEFDTEPCSLKEAIREASRWIGDADRDEVLQVAVPPDLARKVFEIVQANEDIFENLVIPVSGFVLKPRSSTGGPSRNDPMPPKKHLREKIWFQTPRPIGGQSEFPAHEVNSEMVKRLCWKTTPVLHLHLVCEGEPDEEVDRLSTEFDRNLLFVFHRGSNNKNEFDETLYADGTDVVSIPSFMNTLREFQGKEFSKAPRVFWQHPDRECHVSRAVPPQPQVSG